MQTAPRRPNPEGTGSLRPVAALLVVADGTPSPPPRAGPTRRKHPVRGHCYFPDRLLRGTPFYRGRGTNRYGQEAGEASMAASRDPVCPVPTPSSQVPEPPQPIPRTT